MVKIIFGVRILNKKSEKFELENVDLEKTVLDLKEHISERIQYTKEEIELVYCGNRLMDNDKLKDYELSKIPIIHIFKKKLITPYIDKTYDAKELSRIALLFLSVKGTQLSIQARMNILQKVLNEYPEFRKNLGAQALIRDSVLFNSLGRLDVIEKVSQNYSIICDAADFIVKEIKKEIAKNESVNYITDEESFSDLTSSSEEETSGTSHRGQDSSNRRISRNQLAEALLFAGSASLNSLSNLAQRNIITENEEQENATTSTAGVTGISTVPARITSSLFSNALNQAILNTTRAGNDLSSSEPESMDTSEPQLVTVGNEYSQNPYTTELQTMREMGLTDDAVNLQALTLSNGDIESAVNLVLSGMNNLFN